MAKVTQLAARRDTDPGMSDFRVYVRGAVLYASEQWGKHFQAVCAGGAWLRGPSLASAPCSREGCPLPLASLVLGTDRLVGTIHQGMRTLPEALGRETIW